MTTPAAVSQFADLVATSDVEARELPLDRACLLISAVYDSSVDVGKHLSRLDDFAENARATAAAADSYAMTGSILRTLFGEGGFRGNDRAYDEPANSLLASVIERRIGIPITLSIVLMEVSRRLGLPLEGVGLPGHFVVRFPDPTSRLYIDPFRSGAVLDVAGCVELVERIYHGRLTWRDDFLAPLTSRAIVKRVLLNLKNSLSQAKDYAAALTAIQLRMTVDPHDATELRDRGILFARLRRYDRAIDDLEAYLQRSPDAGDSEHIRNTVQYLRQERNL
ncbi:MAG TPA: tetratricopeptide repeat protein [Candidatus Eremiobacteraceae bacterium]|jgi:regulator of sirC expression with transglutaminase-like and TPR domain|nr:tetratricopeptide repeat protein [Candidatus Eremiobacteraceae bacterium]